MVLSDWPSHSRDRFRVVEFLLVCSTTVLMPLAISLRISPTVARKVAMSSGTERVITRPSCVAV